MSECIETISHPESPLSQPSNFNVKETPLIGRDEHYYFIDVIFLVEDSPFKVPRYPFIRSSEVFRDMFWLPVSDGTLPDGSGDDKPVVLEGIAKTDFRRLLMVMFLVSPMDVESISRPEWLSVLKLADNMQKLAIRHILSLPASSDEWIEMLRMSTLQDVSEIREQAIQHLQNLSCGKNSVG